MIHTHPKGPGVCDLHTNNKMDVDHQCALKDHQIIDHHLTDRALLRIPITTDSNVLIQIIRAIFATTRIVPNNHIDHPEIQHDNFSLFANSS